MITFKDAIWHPQFNILILHCDCGIGWRHWAKYSLAQCPNCGSKAWLHSNEAVWDTAIPVARAMGGSDGAQDTIEGGDDR